MSLVELARGTSSMSFHECSGPELVRPRNFKLAFAAVVTCGLVNNFSYCIISGASQNLAEQFNMVSQVTLLSTAMNFAALTGTAISTRFLLRYQYYSRVRLVLAMTAVAYLGVAAAATLGGMGGFVLAAIFSMVGSMAQVFGEISNLAFLKSFPAELIGGWGAGTGIAGIAGGGLYIILGSWLKLPNNLIFALIIPSVLIYWASFHYLHGEVTRAVEGQRLLKALGGMGSEADDWQAEQGAIPVEDAHGHGPRPSGRAAPATCANMKAAIRFSGSIMFNLVAVYCLEYSIHPGLDDRETLCASKVWFTTMWMCYNIGVTMSRLSVAAFRIRKVWLLTVLQLLNVVGWTVEVYTGHIRSLPDEHGYFIMAAWMVVVGLCGGATYGNCMYLFNRQEDIPDDLRELGINLGFVMSNLGITLATFSFSFFNETITAEKVIYPNGCHKSG